jgi:hypothetical protein
MFQGCHFTAIALSSWWEAIVHQRVILVAIPHCIVPLPLCCVSFFLMMLMLLYGAIVLGFTCKRDFWVFYSDCLSNFVICFLSVCWESWSVGIFICVAAWCCFEFGCRPWVASCGFFGKPQLQREPSAECVEWCSWLHRHFFAPSQVYNHTRKWKEWW